MSFSGKNIILTGASGGIGQLLAKALAEQGAKLILVDRDLSRIVNMCQQIHRNGGISFPVTTNFEPTEAILNPAKYVIDQAKARLGQIDMLINNAGILDFTYFDAQSPNRIQQMMHINATVPMLLANALLPNFIKKDYGHIVNIGSVFGFIGFPHYAAYSASKFALRGFSQALQRELTGTQIKVSYIAPRAIKTNMNNESAWQMMKATKTNMDEPEVVVAQILDAILKEKTEFTIGRPESIFAKINGFSPNLVSKGLKKQTKIAQQFLTRPEHH
jgi:short-subunit dehydrogenase